MAKARCPGCGAGMKSPFCTKCGAAKSSKKASKAKVMKTVRPVLTKTAPAVSAADVRAAQLRRQILAEAESGTP